MASPERTCIACRAKRPVAELDRYVANNGHLRQGRSLAGRGAWVCRSGGCFDVAVQKSQFNRAFRSSGAFAPPPAD